MASSIDPVNSVGANSGVNASPRWEAALDSQDPAAKFSCYVLMISALNNLALNNMDAQIVAESQLMNLQGEMQQNMITISQFMSQLQSQESGSPSVWAQLGINSKGGFDLNLSPNAFQGLNYDYYHLGNQSQNYGQEDVSSGYQSALASFEQAFKNLFYANSNANAPTVGSLSSITNPNIGGQSFNLTQYWNELNTEYSSYNRSYSESLSGQQYSSPMNFNVIGTNPGDTASLLQQYMYYQAQVAVLTSPISSVDAAQGDISKLVDFNPNSISCDPFVKQVLQMMTMFNTTEQVNRSGMASDAVAYMGTTSANLLDLMLTNQLNNYTPVSGSATGVMGNAPQVNEDVGLYGAFSYMAFNDYWAKNPNSQANNPEPNPGNWLSETGWDGVNNGDDLTALSTSMNSIQTNIGTLTSNDSSEMQEITANEGEYTNVGQNTIQNMTTAMTSYNQNQLNS